MNVGKAIFRTQKLKTWGEVVAACRHNERTAISPNIDPSKLHLNEHIETKNIDIQQRINVRIGNQKVRKNGVLAVEVLVGFSGSVRDSVDKDEWFKAANDFLEHEFGKENIVSLSLHLDEKTPHAHAIFVPIDGKGKLNCRHFLGDPVKLKRLQTEYAKVCEPFGLERGIEGSKRKHIPQRELYTATCDIEEQVEHVKNSFENATKVEIEPLNPIHAMQPSKRKKWFEKQKTELVSQLKNEVEGKLQPIANLASQVVLAKRDARALEHTTRELVRTKEELIQVKSNYKQQTDRLRDIPLADVMIALGIDGHKQGNSTVYQTPTSKITITDEKFMDWKSGKGGGGAIDLAMYVLETDFKNSLRWLIESFPNDGQGAAYSAALKRADTLIIEAKKSPLNWEEKCEKWAKRDDSQWHKVLEYLTQKRALTAKRIHELFERGDIYANERASAVFVHRCLETGKIIGATIRGIFNHFKQCIGDKVSAFFSIGKPIDNSDRLFLTESPIDAISLMELAKNPDATYLSTAGTTPLDQLRQHYAGKKVILAFDDDLGGEKMRKHANDIFKACEISVLTPSTGKDWNETLIAQTAMASKMINVTPTLLPQSHDLQASTQQQKQSIKITL